jgi:peptidoglycan hydrolase CwlO-like protein
MISSGDIISIASILIGIVSTYNAFIVQSFVRRFEKMEEKIDESQKTHIAIATGIARIDGDIKTINAVMQARREHFRSTDYNTDRVI